MSDSERNGRVTSAHFQNSKENSENLERLGGEELDDSNISWLTSVPATDLNFKYHLKAATTEEIKEALSIITAKGEKGCVSKISALSRELRRRDKDAKES